MPPFILNVEMDKEHVLEVYRGVNDRRNRDKKHLWTKEFCL